MTERLTEARRIVVKVGSALLTKPDSDAIETEWLATLADDLARLRARARTIPDLLRAPPRAFDFDERDRRLLPCFCHVGRVTRCKRSESSRAAATHRA